MWDKCWAEWRHNGPGFPSKTPARFPSVLLVFSPAQHSVRERGRPFTKAPHQLVNWSWSSKLPLGRNQILTQIPAEPLALRWRAGIGRTQISMVTGESRMLGPAHLEDERVPFGRKEEFFWGGRHTLASREWNRNGLSLSQGGTLSFGKWLIICEGKLQIVLGRGTKYISVSSCSRDQSDLLGDGAGNHVLWRKGEYGKSETAWPPSIIH